MAQTAYTRADMMMARDAVGVAYNAMRAADAAMDADMTERTVAAVATAQKAWKRAVMRREAMERAMWAAQSAEA